MIKKFEAAMKHSFQKVHRAESSTKPSVGFHKSQPSWPPVFKEDFSRELRTNIFIIHRGLISGTSSPHGWMFKSLILIQFAYNPYMSSCTLLNHLQAAYNNQYNINTMQMLPYCIVWVIMTRKNLYNFCTDTGFF